LAGGEVVHEKAMQFFGAFFGIYSAFWMEPLTGRNLSLETRGFLISTIRQVSSGRHVRVCKLWWSGRKQCYLLSIRKLDKKNIYIYIYLQVCPEKIYCRSILLHKETFGLNTCPLSTAALLKQVRASSSHLVRARGLRPHPHRPTRCHPRRRDRAGP